MYLILVSWIRSGKGINNIHGVQAAAVATLT